MVQNQEISSFCVVVLALLLFMINSAELKPKNGPEIRRLIEMKTVDDKGVVRARVVAEYEQTNTEEQKSSSESAASTKRYQDDDEDSMGTSSGDSETYGESYDMIANDDPMGVPSANQSSSESSGSPSQSSSRSINSTSKPIDSKSSTVLPTTGQINASTPSSTTVREHVSTTTKMETTTSIPQTTSQATTTGTKVTVTTGTSANATTLSTLSSSTNNMQKNTTTFPPPVTEVETTAPATTTTSTPTTTATLKPTTQSNVNETTPFEVSTTGKSNNENTTVSPTKASVTSPGRVPDVKGQTDTEAKATRKTLFGFVTVEILIALLAGALFSVLLVAFLVYRLKKRNEGSYELSETIALRPKEIDEMGKKKEVFV